MEFTVIKCWWKAESSVREEGKSAKWNVTFWGGQHADVIDDPLDPSYRCRLPSLGWPKVSDASSVPYLEVQIFSHVDGSFKRLLCVGVENNILSYLSMSDNSQLLSVAPDVKHFKSIPWLSRPSRSTVSTAPNDQEIERTSQPTKLSQVVGRT